MQPPHPVWKFGMPQVEAGACGKPVIGIKAMGMLDTLIHKKTAFLADVAQKIVVKEVVLGKESGFENKHKIQFDIPRTVDYRANVQDIAKYMFTLMNNEDLGLKWGGRLQGNMLWNILITGLWPKNSYRSYEINSESIK